ncbi:MAG: DNA mismatch repair protein MutT, partial [Planctomycetota bacterium]
MENPEGVSVLAAGRYLSLVRQGRWEYARRVNCTGAVVIIATTDDDRIILVEQFRTPLGKPVIELP